MKKIIFVFSLALLFSACSYHSGNISTGSHIDCPLIYVATGTASCTKVFEIGGLKTEGLILEAKRDLYKKFPYKKGIKLSNFSVDYKNTFILFFIHTIKATVSADVYDCNIIPSDNLENNLPLAINGFRVGDSILYHKDFDILRATIKEHRSGDQVKISYYNQLFSEKTDETTSYSNIFKTTTDPENINNFGFEIGEEVTVAILNNSTGIKSKRRSTIKAINAEFAVIQFSNIYNIETVQIVDKQLLRKK